LGNPQTSRAAPWHREAKQSEAAYNHPAAQASGSIATLLRSGVREAVSRGKISGHNTINATWFIARIRNMTEFKVSRRDLGRGLAVLCAGTSFVIRPAFAALPQPSERPILTISGKISITNDGDTAKFDRPMLEALGMQKFTTHTKWDNDPVTFEGPLMVELMKAVGASGETAQAVALNDYHTDIPIADFALYKPILALKRDGVYMSVREKGPLFVVYNYDSDPELKQQKYYGRSAWQVAQFVIK
jgi:hypothetical protein